MWLNAPKGIGCDEGLAGVERNTNGAWVEGVAGVFGKNGCLGSRLFECKFIILEVVYEMV